MSWEGLTLKVGGTLLESQWDPETRTYPERDVTAHAPRLLFEPCRLEDGVTLRDVFLLIERHLAAFDHTLRYWCPEFVREAVHTRPRRECEELEYLELAWEIRLTQDKTHGQLTLCGHLNPEFQGVGFPLETDKEYEGAIVVKAGERERFGLHMTPLCDIAHLPLRLNTTAKVVADEGTTVVEARDAQFLLAHILHSIIWEVSFFGPPEKRDRTAWEMAQETERKPIGSREPFKWDHSAK